MGCNNGSNKRGITGNKTQDHSPGKFQSHCDYPMGPILFICCSGSHILTVQQQDPAPIAHNNSSRPKYGINIPYDFWCLAVCNKYTHKRVNGGIYKHGWLYVRILIRYEIKHSFY